MHSLRRLHESLPGLWGYRRPCLWRDLSGTPGRCTRSGAGWAGEDLPSAVRVELLRTLRSGLPRQDSLDENHALLARRIFCPWHSALPLQHRPEVMGMGCTPPEFLPPNGIRSSPCHAHTGGQERAHPLASGPERLVRGARPRETRGRKLPIAMAEASMTAARDTILATLAKGRSAVKPVPNYVLPPWTNDAPGHFMAKAKASVAEVHTLSAVDEAPESILAIMAANQLQPRLHLPSTSPLQALPWHRAPGLKIAPEPPSGNDSALSQADYGIAETGTLVFLSGPQSASSWHFRPGCEFVLLPRYGIVPRFEDIIMRIKALGRMPATLNLITGPSRTADIEQTIELGAHGP